MDPQKLSKLDPKLREAYQRVMGTTIPEPQAPTQTPSVAPVSAPNPVPQGSIGSTPEPQPAINPQPQPTPIVDPFSAAQPTTNFTQMNSEVPAAPTAANFATPAPQAQNMVIKKKNGFMPVVFVVVGLIFIVIYTFFWTKIFNLKLPFLPSYL